MYHYVQYTATTYSIAHSSICHCSSAHASLPANLNLWAIDHPLNCPKAELHKFQLFFHVKDNSLPHLASLSLLNDLCLSMVAWQSCELSHHASIIPLWLKSRNCTQTSNSSCLFLCCVYQCRGSSGRHPSVLIPQYSFESFLHVAVLQWLPSLHAYAWRDSTSALFCWLLCLILITQALGLPTPSTSSLLVEESLSPVFFWFKENWVV